MSEHGAQRIAKAFAAAHAQGRCAIIPFLVAGDPDLETTRLVLQSLVAAGADIIELGVPYSDPLADGPSIVAAGQRALAAGTTLDAVIDLIADVPVPVVLFTYANPIVQYGVERLGQRLQAVGAAGAIIPDLPLEETIPISKQLDTYGLAVPLLIAPTTPPARAQRIVAASSGFVYLVTRLGVTGAGSKQSPDPSSIATQVEALRKTTALPIAAGFGLARSEQIAAITSVVDGAIVGSALIDALVGHQGAMAASVAGKFISALRPGATRSTASA
jgi:tryptophan synthase alpha chain